LALSTANLWKAVQPGGSLFGLQHSNPVNTDVAYRSTAQSFGTSNDAMVGGRIGGVNVFGGGLALYDKHGQRVGGVGVSGDTSCRDHKVAWELRHNLGARLRAQWREQNISCCSRLPQRACGPWRCKWWVHIASGLIASMDRAAFLKTRICNVVKSGL
jgi:Haem-degrading